MARTFFGSGFFSPAADPAAYLALVAFFGGDRASADAYLALLQEYAADGAEAQDLLDASEAAGTPAEAIAILAAGGQQTFVDRVDQIVDAACVCAVVPTLAGGPYLDDRAGTFAAGDWAASLDRLSGSPAWQLAGRGATSTNVAVSGPVQIPGECSIHVGVADTSAGGSAGYVAGVAAPGETESANYMWSLRLTPSSFSYFAETGAGSNQTVDWIRAAGAGVSRTFLLSLTRSATGRLRLYKDGVLLAASTVSGAGGSLGPGGAYADLPLPTGGSATKLYWTSDPTEAPPDADLALVAIYDVEHDAATVAAIATALGYA
jgi:hypothetical protein